MAEPARELQTEAALEPVELGRADVARLRAVLEPPARDRLERAGSDIARLLKGRRLWHLNSTASGGGVAEMLTWALPLLSSLAVDVRWMVLEAPPAFFELTKRIHHLLHESPRELAPGDRRLYESSLAPAAAELEAQVRPGDVVVVHDPQPAGLIPSLARLGAAVIWRCHVGTDHPGEHARRGQEFLLPYVEKARLQVFSRAAFAWPGLARARVRIIQPAIDPLAPKNQELASGRVDAILAAAGVRGDAGGAEPTFTRAEGAQGEVTRPAEILQEAPVPVEAPLVTQVSRWDPLKDPAGVMEGFVEHVPEALDAHLVLAGPVVKAVSDDPEGRRVLEDVRGRWRGLPPAARRRVHIAALPMDDLDENAAVVNALQRASTVVVQKSLREGFGLTVAEALWKSRAVVASRVGGIQEQVEDGVSGLLLDDPGDLEAFGRRLAEVLADARLRDRLGEAARRRVCDEFLPDRLAADWEDAFERALAP